MNRKPSIALIALLLGLITITNLKAQSEQALNTVITEFLESIENDVAADNNKGSISITILKGDQSLWSGAYGLADASKNLKADSEKIYRTGSISKTFTAFLMMQLVEEGIIQLDDPIEKYLPEVRQLEGYGDSTKITFHHLASHTSGLIREPQLPDAASGPIAEWEAKVLESIPETSFKTGLDKAYSYSNIGFGMLGLALSRAANKSFMELVEEKIFKPLNMTNSFFIVPESQLADLAAGMRSDGKGTVHSLATREHKGRGYKVPNGGIYSTPDDLMKFMNAIMGYGELLSKESLTLMRGSHTPRGNYGYGLSRFKDASISTVGHGGSVAGYNCYMAFDQESEYGVVLMRNYNRGETNLGQASLELIRKLKALGSK